MKNKSLALVAAILLSAGIAFSFANTSQSSCCTAESAQQNGQTCCDLPCPIEDCPIECCQE